jgi:asparagine synthase (glutamine-hydrolysing)
MCGVAGFLQPAGFPADDAESLVRDLAARISHRGPDDADTWLDADAGIALGHQRLSIVDLSSAGRQPMASASGRYVISFNGEIYNHLQIRKDLELTESPPAWRGHSDTETLLAAFDHWGVESALNNIVGMFAIALWDRDERTLTLARDRIGEKPLYYGWQDKCFLFGSELKALRAHPAFCPEIDRSVLALYLRRGYIPAPHSIYANIFKVLPGTFIQLAATDAPGTLPEARTYWCLRDAATHGLSQTFAGNDEDAANELDTLLRQAISLQKIADVPLGAFLSGGIDSSTIVALMQAESSRPVKTFTIGFHEGIYNEAEHAKRVAKHLGTEHTELYVTPREAMDVIPQLPQLYDEPFGDSSAIPTFLVSQLARQQVTVSLSGDGGDELFGGYSRYQRANDAWRMTRRFPNFARNAVSRCISTFSGLSRTSPIAWKANRAARYLSARNAAECYQVQITPHSKGFQLVKGDFCEKSLMNDSPDFDLPAEDSISAMTYLDMATYLPDDILAKVDRASMGVSLESRVPMLDHRVVEFAWCLPPHMKVRGREGKWILKQLLRKYIPDSMIERPKMGFGVPVGQWIQGPLRDWAESLLSESRLQEEGFLNPGLVRDQWSQHIKGTTISGDAIWHILMFQAWLSSVSSSPSVQTR